MLESNIQRKILNYLRQHEGAVVWKLDEQTLNGVPDIFFAYKKIKCFFEVKRPSGSVKPKQIDTIKKLNKNGMPAYIVYSVEEVKEILFNLGLDFQK